MEQLAHQIDRSLHEIILSSENQLEILVGSCQSGMRLTNTQEHILMLIENNAFTNKEIAKQLNVSQAAITKAIKALIAQDLLVAVRDSRDARIVRYSLTELAKPIAEEHAHHHAQTLASYEDLVGQYSEEEQAIIGHFLTELVKKIRKEV
ncbi:zinc-dependent MarR family transcriptional regulator [Streptococcus cuniculi]|uniref:MarR family transcriptional regulator n=1 Tax=Streptococcus cuniculi TaxID=1432788 RepID=A0A4Y9JAC9_9STRE|nr:zinc-dependent MarR family transcriptional regulator [Streptococcus cuniculi]MBF0779008.1 winged helix DNA-binding protein [Streptococcus cuniculi]TFU97056.1 MarR family transcriptional regulator [Streptococcus cuniculi]